MDDMVKSFGKYYYNNGMAVGIVRFMFGYRVQSGYVASEGDEPMVLCTNWCCGVNLGNLSLAYTVLKRMIDKGADIKGLPTASDIKPYHKDPDFMKTIFSLAADHIHEEKLIQVEPMDLLEADKMLNQGIEHHKKP